MNLEVIAIGDELLSGHTLNTNVKVISEALNSAGFNVRRHLTLPDEAELLKKGLEESLSRVPLVICTGGLGPTCDDLTKSIVSDLFGRELKQDPDLLLDLERRFPGKAISIQNQALVPVGAKIFTNPNGTASGLLITQGEKKMILMPGVPKEMEPMLYDHVIPYLMEYIPPKEREHRRCIHFYTISESRIDPLLRKLQEEYPNLKFSIYPNFGLVDVHVSQRSKDAEESGRLLDEACAKIQKEFASNSFVSKSGSIEDSVHELLLEKKLTLSLAESCTGGAIGSVFTSLSGASNYFLGGIIAYSYEVKEKILNVKRETLEKYGAVSPETVKEMFEGAIECTRSDYAIAVSGILGPSGAVPGKPVGTVWAAVGRKGQEPHIWNLNLAATSRQIARAKAVNYVLGELYRQLSKTD